MQMYKLNYANNVTIRKECQYNFIIRFRSLVAESSVSKQHAQCTTCALAFLPLHKVHTEWLKVRTCPGDIPGVTIQSM